MMTMDILMTKWLTVLTGLDEIESIDDVIDGAVCGKMKRPVVRLQSKFERGVTVRYRLSTKQCTCAIQHISTSHDPTQWRRQKCQSEGVRLPFRPFLFPPLFSLPSSA